MKTRFLSILSTFALAVCALSQPFVKNTVTTNEVVSGVLTPTHNLVTVRTNFTVTGTQNVNDLQASTLTITNSWNAIGATNMLMANMRSSTNATLSIGVSNIYAGGELAWPTGHVAYLFATNANYGSANVTNLYTLITNSPVLATDGNGKLIGTNSISASNLISGTNNSASIGAAEFVAGRFTATNTSQGSTFAGKLSIGTTNFTRPFHVQSSAQDAVYVSDVTPAVVLGNNTNYANLTYNAAFGLCTDAGNLVGSSQMGDTVLGGSSNILFATGLRSGQLNGTMRMAISTSGNVGIGTNAPDALLTIGHTAPSADQVMLDIKARGTNVFSVDEDGDVVNQGTLTTMGNTYFGGTSNAHPGIVTAGNNGNYLSAPVVVGAFGSMTMATTNTVDLVTTSVSVLVTNYTRCATNYFTCDPAAGVMTNLYAGWYRVALSTSGQGSAANAQTFIAQVRTNTVAVTGCAWIRSSTSTAFGSMAANDTIYLPANTRVDVAIQSDAASPDDFVVNRMNIHVGTP